MIKKIFAFIIILGICIFIKGLYSKQSFSNSAGAPPGYSGSPSDGYDCSACHSHMDSTIDNVSWITTDVPVYGFNHTMSYNFTVTIPDSGQKGFEISILDNSGNQAGYMMTVDASTQLVGSGKYITHTASGTANPQTWSFQWVQNNPGYGNATIYGAFTVDTNETYIQTINLPEEPCENCHWNIPVSYFDNTRICSFYTGNTIRIFMNQSVDKNINIFMYSADGALVKLFKDAFHNKSLNYYDIDTSSLNNGMYIIVASCNAFTEVSKIIVSK